ncbi:ABC transporter substrate-binding protein [Egicoccus sp. AB-alg6-2]|uniref:ABC transporter substrate-binding protein n=1 Tax=Egicoccus sp. AB-alg6-2 TaxID=3242692 RepID=UPI00359D7365
MRIRLLSLTAAIALVLAACGDGGGGVDLDDPGAEPDTTDPGGDGDAEGDADGESAAEGGTLIAAIGGEPDQLNPLTTTSGFAFTIFENVYDTLVQPGDDLTMEPALAESWETSDDLLTWVFTLREGVTFHDGSTLDAQDVVATYEYIAEEGANNWRLTGMSFEATDDATVTVNLEQPAPNILEQLGGFKGMAIVPAEQIEAGTLGDEVIGTGPFQLTSSGADVIELQAFDDYWGEGPHLDGIEFRIIPDEGVKLTNLETGEVDWIDSVPPEQVVDLENGDDVVIGRVAGLDYWYMALNHDREPFDQVEVRRAIAFALNPEDIAEATHFEAATPTETAIPEGSFWHHDYTPFGHDPEEAQRLLDEAGVEGLSIDLMVSNEHPESVTAAQVIESQLGEVGIDVQIRTEDFTTWLADQGAGDFDAFMLGWLRNLDPDDFYYAQHHSEGGSNFQGFSDPEVDRLLDEGRAELDDDARKEIYDQAAELIVDQASYIYFYNPDVIQAWSHDVSDYDVRPDAVRFVTTRLNR